MGEQVKLSPAPSLICRPGKAAPEMGCISPCSHKGLTPGHVQKHAPDMEDVDYVWGRAWGWRGGFVAPHNIPVVLISKPPKT